MGSPFLPFSGFTDEARKIYMNKAREKAGSKDAAARVKQQIKAEMESIKQQAKFEKQKAKDEARTEKEKAKREEMVDKRERRTINVHGKAARLMAAESDEKSEFNYFMSLP